MTAHRCDPQFTPEGGGGPLTDARVLALILAFGIDGGDPPAADAVVAEVAGCDQCTVTLLGACAAVAGRLFADYVPDARMALELQLAAYRAAAGNVPG